MPIPAELEPVFDAAGEKYNVDPDMLRAVALQESNGNPNIPDSSKGAQGMMQIMPPTAAGLGDSPGGINPKDPVQAINGAAQLLSNKLTEAERLRASGVAVDPPSYAVMSYFAGKPGSSWGPQTWQYGDQVAAKYRNLTAANGAAPMAGLAETPGQGSDGGATAPAVATANARGPDLVRLASAGVSDVGPSAASAPDAAGGPPPAPSQYAQSPSQYAAGMLRQLAASGKSPQSTAGPAGGPIPPPGANPVATPSIPSAGAGGGPGAVPVPAPSGSVPYDPVGGQLLADLGRQARAMEVAGLPGAQEMEQRYQAALRNGWIPDDTGQPHYLSGTSTAAGQISRAEAEGTIAPTMVPMVINGQKQEVPYAIAQQLLQKQFAGVTAAAPATPPPGRPGPAAGAGTVPAPVPPPVAPQYTVGGEYVMTPEQTKTSGAYGDQAAENLKAGAAAPDILGRVQILRAAANQFQDAPGGGFGPFAPERIAMGNRLLDVINQTHVPVPQSLLDGLQKMVASGQIIGKEQGQLTAQLVRELGSREAAQIYNATQNYTPGVPMSRGGYDAIVNSIEQGAMRDTDKANFQTQWLADPTHNKSIAGMQQAFNQAHPIETYTSKVMPIPADQAGGQFVPGAIYLNKSGLRAVRTPDGQWQPVQ
jgi:Transglycosylase SLT domain